MRDAGGKLILLPQLGNDIFARGTPERPRTRTTTTYDATLFDLLKAYGRQRAKGGPQNLQIHRTELYSVDQAVARLSAMLGAMPGWRALSSFLPRDLQHDPLLSRSALASTFAATLRSEERRVGKECVGPFRSRWTPVHKK